MTSKLFPLFLSLAILLSCNSKPNNKAASSELAETDNKVLSTPQSESLILKADTSDMVFFEGRKILIGADEGSARHQPSFEMEINSFYIDKYPVSVKQFSQFVKATGHKTDAEKYGDSGVFNFSTGSWELIKGAYWKLPQGPGKTEANPNHPVTQVSWTDAMSYAKWAGKTLATEFEWEYAAKNGDSEASIFPWGNEEKINETYMANTWQGSTPTEPDPQDGFLLTSPLGSFPATPAGLYDMSGNVWEWCENTFEPYEGSSLPMRPDPNVKAIRGGSFMYDEQGAESFSVYGRSFNTSETSLFNTGFRCALRK